jgi:peptide/nickel transport system permease protein
LSRYAAFLLRRLVQACVIIVGIVVVNFVVVHLAPGDLAEVLAGQGGGADAGYVAALRERFGLDQTLWVQFGRYVWNLLHFDLGYSFRESLPVSVLIADKLMATLILMVSSLTIAFVLGVGLGILAAMRPNSLVDALVSLLALIGYATPLFWLGLLLILLFTVKLGWLPSGGMRTIGVPSSGLAGILDIARHAVMPVMTLTLFYMAVFIGLMRASVLNVASLDFVRSAYAKGMSRSQVYIHHILGNALLPMITMLGVNVGGILGGSVVVETVFGWPGLGRLTFDAIFARDINLLLGILFFSSLLVVVTNLATDLLSAWIDPRIEVSA